MSDQGGEVESHASGGRPSRRCPVRWPLLALVAICATIYIANLDGLQVGQHVDDALYISVGRSLAAGLGYVRYEDPRHPPEPQYPPGLPLLVAAVLRLGGDVETLRIIPLLFSLISLILADVYFRSRLPCAGADACGPWRWLLLALFGLNHLVVGYAGMVMGEAPFICMTLAALILLSPGLDGAAQGRRLRWSAGIALAFAGAVLFRSAGLALIAGALAWMLRRGWRLEALAVAGLTALLLTPWLIFQRMLTGEWLGAGYGADIVGEGNTTASLMLRIPGNLAAYATRLLPETVLPFFGERVEGLLARLSLEPIGLVLGAAVTAAVITGGVICARRRSLPDGWIAVVFAVLLLAWSFRYTRFVLPILPIALIYLLSAARTLAPRRPGVLYALAGLALAGFALRDAAMVADPPRALYPDLRAAGEFVTEHTEADSLIVTERAAGLALYADCDALEPIQLKAGAERLQSAEAAIRAALTSRPVYLLVLDEASSILAGEWLRAEDLRIEVVAGDPASAPALYRLALAGDGANTAAARDE